MKIQSVMKNYTVLFQHLPAVLDDDAAGVFSNAAAVVVVYQTRIYGLDGRRLGEDSRGIVIENGRKVLK